MSMTTVYDKYLEQAPDYSELKTWLYMMHHAAQQLDEWEVPRNLQANQIGYDIELVLIAYDVGLGTIELNNIKLPDGYDPHTVASINSLAERRPIETIESYLAQQGSTRFSIAHIPPTGEYIRLINEELPDMDTSALDILGAPYIGLNRDTAPNMNYFGFPRGYASLGGHVLREPVGNVIQADKIPLYALRELKRISDSEYTELPPAVRQHIPADVYAAEVPHLAVKGANAGKVAYTENATKGDNDVQSVMKPGKYIRRVMKNADINDQELKDMVAEMQSASRVEIRTTRDPEEARWVYMNGPDSCMAHGEDRFGDTFDEDDTWRHPMEALFFEDGSGGVELVYALANNGRPAARVLTNAEVNTYPSVYGADWMPAARAILEEWLTENGYMQCPNALANLPIPLIRLNTPGKILCPYIDSNNLGVDVNHSTDELTIGGPFEADYDDGFIDLHSNHIECHNCGDRFDEDDMTFVDSVDEHVCDSCIEDDYVDALDEDGSVELHRDCDCEHLDHDVSVQTSCGILRISHITDRTTDTELEQVGLCRDHSGTVEEQDDCMMVDDIEEWVLTDHIETGNNIPEAVDPDAEFVVLHDHCIVSIRDAIYAEELGGWVHEDDIDNETERPYSVLHHPDDLRTAELVEADDAA